jgi:predicted alpha/beta superfamily hydrolase
LTGKWFKKTMRTFSITCLIVAFVTAGFAQKKHTSPIEIGEIINVHSSILNEERPIYVSLPPGYDTLTSNIPVIYVLDAEYRFGVAHSIQSYFYITTKIPKAILVGIANPSTEALSEELFPLIEQKYKAKPKRYLAGHSHGGVFVIYTLLNNANLFEGYIAIDPSLKHIYNDRDTLLNQELTSKKLYLASSDVAYGYLEDVAADMQADFAIFKNHLYQTREKNKLNFKIDHINDDHGNSYIQGFSRGLRYLFNWRYE